MFQLALPLWIMQDILHKRLKLPAYRASIDPEGNAHTDWDSRKQFALEMHIEDDKACKKKIY